MTRGDLIVIALILIPVMRYAMRGYYASQQVSGFRKKSGRNFGYNPIKHYI